jgi:ligand-binding sensor domain-containing protein
VLCLTRSADASTAQLPGHGIDCDVLSIAESRDGKLWVGTSGEGLYEFDSRTGQCRYCTVHDRFRSNAFRGPGRSELI